MDLLTSCQRVSCDSVKSEILYSFCTVNAILLVSARSLIFPNRAITLENQLVILATSVVDAGGYYVQAVNEKNGENKTSPLIHLSIASKYPNTWRRAVVLRLQEEFTKLCPNRAFLRKDSVLEGDLLLLLGLEQLG